MCNSSSRPASSWSLTYAKAGRRSANSFELPVPEGKPFPHLNDAAEFQARIKRLSLIFRLIGFVAVAVFALILAGLAAIFFYR